MTITPARQPQGVPVGGQFAANVHAEADLSLCPATPSSNLQQHRDKIARVSAEMARITKEVDATYLDFAAAAVLDIVPNATELRIRSIKTGDRAGHKIPTFLGTADGDFIGARYSKGANADWAWRKIDAEYPGSVYEVVNEISADSPVWDEDARCGFDPDTGERILYLNGRTAPNTAVDA